jgi:hypothetical protein
VGGTTDIFPSAWNAQFEKEFKLIKNVNW